MKTRKILGWMTLTAAVIGGACAPSGTWVCEEETGALTVSTSTTIDTSDAMTCGECDSYTDCPISKNHCRAYACQEGRCVEEDLAPEHLCDDSYPCWQGACCYTCVVDSGAYQQEVDLLDGPCVSGQDDHLCGFGGGLCEDCTLAGKVCSMGQCVEVQ